MSKKELDFDRKWVYSPRTHNGESYTLVTVECPRCQTEIRISEDAEWFRCLKCSHEGGADTVERLD